MAKEFDGRIKYIHLVQTSRPRSIFDNGKSYKLCDNNLSSYDSVVNFLFSLSSRMIFNVVPKNFKEVTCPKCLRMLSADYGKD